MVNGKLILADFNRFVKEARAIRNRWKRRVAVSECRRLGVLLTVEE